MSYCEYQYASRVKQLKNDRMQVKYANIYIALNMNIFNVEYHAIIDIVRFDLGQVAQKWSSVSRIYEYQSTRSLLTLYM